MKTNKSILTPEGMYSFAGKALRPCFILAIIVILAAMYVGFFLAPVDATQGNSYRILYIHVACALDGHAALCGDGDLLLFGPDYRKPPLADGCCLFSTDRLSDGFPCTLDRFSLGAPDMGRLLGLGRASYQCLDSVLLLFRLYRAAERHSRLAPR